jgi:hypothetical protein
MLRHVAAFVRLLPDFAVFIAAPARARRLADATRSTIFRNDTRRNVRSSDSRYLVEAG